MFLSMLGQNMTRVGEGMVTVKRWYKLMSYTTFTIVIIIMPFPGIQICLQELVSISPRLELEHLQGEGKLPWWTGLACLSLVLLQCCCFLFPLSR
jgi:hypothetical protein